MPDLDPTTPWKSQGEMTAARSERDYLNRSRYEFDETHRLAWDSKTVLGFVHDTDDPQVTAVRPGLQTDGTDVTPLMSGQAVAGPGDLEAQQKISDLKREVAALEAEEARLIRQDPAGLLLNRPEKSGKPSDVKPYKTQADMVRDMGSPEYRNNPDYRAYVEARMAVSDIIPG